MKAQPQVQFERLSSKPPAWPAMSAWTRAGTVVVWLVFAVYLAFLVKLLLLSREPGSIRSLNLVPFATISIYLSTASAAAGRFALGNVLGNVAAFVPFGSCLPLVQGRTRVWPNLRVVVASSVAVEIAQGLFGVGACDIDDVILNTLGGLLGTLFFTGLRVMLRSWARVVTVLAALSVVGLPVLSFLLFVVRLRM
ncbi:VanZ family protein [Pedococcus sp. NPDC057267]|uniref:VanZ family protein n=1 Tax=Pedococcus sp. NPDC057267 TaxID=3346077 RepID=UPI00363AC51A